jgi:hypothetical protein
MVPDFGGAEDTTNPPSNANPSETPMSQLPDGDQDIQTVGEGTGPTAQSSEKGKAGSKLPRQSNKMDNMPTPSASSRSSQAPTPQTAEGDEDVEMVEGNATVLARSYQKGKGKAVLIPGVVQTPRPKPTRKRTIPAEPSKKAKRELSSSPSKPDGPATSIKRPRTVITAGSHRGINRTLEMGKEGGLLPPGIRLSGVTMAEGDAVDTQVVPQAVRAVSAVLTIL